jgi:hypothetical protein
VYFLSPCLITFAHAYSAAQFSGLVDVNARYRNLEEVFALEQSYGEVERLLRIQLPASHALGLSTPKWVAYAIIRPVKLDRNDGIPGLDVPFYTRAETHYDAIDAQYVECLIGRVPLEHGQWAIIDRTGAASRAVYGGEDDADADLTQ